MVDTRYAILIFIWMMFVEVRLLLLSRRSSKSGDLTITTGKEPLNLNNVTIKTGDVRK